MISNLYWDSPIFTILSFTGIAFTVMGFIMYIFPPKKINNLYGIRTQTSMRNQQTWDYSQKYGSKAMMITGIIHVLFGTIGLFVTLNETMGSLLGLGIMIFLTLFYSVYVELQLKKKFPN